MVEPDERPAADEITDSLSEFASILGELMKVNALDPYGDYTLGSPQFVQPSGGASGEEAGSLLYRQVRGALSLEVWVGDQEGGCSDECN